MGKLKTGAYVALGLILLYVFWFYIRVWYFLNSYTYGYSITKIDAGGIKDISDLGSGKAYIDVFFDFDLNNISAFKTQIDDLKIDFYYQGFYLGKSYDFKQIKILPESTTKIPGKARIYVNKALLNILLFAQKQNIKLDYVASLRVYGMPFTVTFRDSYEFNLKDYTS